MRNLSSFHIDAVRKRKLKSSGPAAGRETVSLQPIFELSFDRTVVLAAVKSLSSEVMMMGAMMESYVIVSHQ